MCVCACVRACMCVRSTQSMYEVPPLQTQSRKGKVWYKLLISDSHVATFYS